MSRNTDRSQKRGKSRSTFSFAILVVQYSCSAQLDYRSYRVTSKAPRGGSVSRKSSRRENRERSQFARKAKRVHALVAIKRTLCLHLNLNRTDYQIIETPSRHVGMNYYLLHSHPDNNVTVVRGDLSPRENDNRSSRETSGIIRCTTGHDLVMTSKTKPVRFEEDIGSQRPVP